MGGQATKDTILLASKGAHLVVSGTMAKEDVLVLQFPLMSKDIHVRGFWGTDCFNSSTFEERATFLDELVRLMVGSNVATCCACCRVSDRLITPGAVTVSFKNWCRRLSRSRARSAVEGHLQGTGIFERVGTKVEYSQDRNSAKSVTVRVHTLPRKMQRRHRESRLPAPLYLRRSEILRAVGDTCCNRR